MLFAVRDAERAVITLWRDASSADALSSTRTYNVTVEEIEVTGFLRGVSALELFELEGVKGGSFPAALERVELHGTAMLADLAAEHGLRHLTYVSGFQGRGGARPGHLESKVKLALERAIARSGVPFTIFKPTYFMKTLPRHIRGRRAVVIGRRQPPLHMVAGADFRQDGRGRVPDAGGGRPRALRPRPRGGHGPGRAAAVLLDRGTWHAGDDRSPAGHGGGGPVVHWWRAAADRRADAAVAAGSASLGTPARPTGFCSPTITLPQWCRQQAARRAS